MTEGNKPPTSPPPLRPSPKAVPPPIRTPASTKPPIACGRPNRVPPTLKMKKKPTYGRFVLTDPNTGQSREVELAPSNKAIVEHTPTGADGLRYGVGYRFGDITVLIATTGQCALLCTSIENTARLLRNVARHDRLEPLSDNRRLLVALDKTDTRRAVLLSFTNNNITFGDGRVIVIDNIQHYIIARHSPGFKQIDVVWSNNDAKAHFSLVAPEKAAEDAMVAIQSRQANKYAAGNATLADLYRAYNELRKEEYLFVLFADLILLDRRLQEGIGISELVRQLESKGGVEFAENKVLSETTIAKVLVLSEGIRLTKQKLELLASMYPYFWLQQDAERLAAVFGNKIPHGLLETKRRRLVPRMRQDIRTIQGTILRSLAEIESGSRQIDNMLARDEVKRHWSSKAMRWGPAIIQGGLAISYLLMTGGAGAAAATTSILNSSQAIGARMLAGVIGTQAAGQIFGFFQQDKEASAQVKRAAEIIFPWWDIFRNTLAVCIFEAGQFLGDLLTDSMKQDRDIIDKIAPDDKSAVVARLRAVLTDSISLAHKRRASSFIVGGDIRLADVIQDIRLTTGPVMRQTLSDFSKRLTLGTDKKEYNHDRN